MEVECSEGSAVYLLVFYGGFCIGPSKTQMFLLVSALEFEHFDGLAADMGKTCIRMPSLSMFEAWQQILAKLASEC